MRMSNSIKELATALVKAQQEIAPVKKDKVNPFFKSSYVGLESVMPEALRVLNKHGLALTQTVGTAEDGSTNLSTTILHTSGEWLTDSQPLLLVKPDPQGQGSAITYARRYGVMSALGIVGEEDDDGNKASPRVAQTDRPAPPKPRRTAPDPRNNGKANSNQISIIMRLLEKQHGGDERAQVETIKKINPHAVNETGTALVFGPLTQDEAGDLIIELQKKRQEPDPERALAEASEPA